MGIWDLSAIPKYFLKFLPAAVVTIEIAFMGIIIGIILGLLFAFMRISKFKAVNYPAKAYIWLIRGTPLLLQILFIYNGLVKIILLDKFVAAALALGIHNGAYIAEIFRGAIQSVDRGQREAGKSIGMKSWQIMRRIIFPQAFKRAIPPLSNQLIIAVKDSSLASVCSVPELLLYARQVGSSQFLFMEMLMIAAIYYLIITSILTLIANLVEKRLKVSDHRV